MAFASQTRQVIKILQKLKNNCRIFLCTVEIEVLRCYNILVRTAGVQLHRVVFRYLIYKGFVV